MSTTICLIFSRAFGIGLSLPQSSSCTHPTRVFDLAYSGPWFIGRQHHPIVTPLYQDNKREHVINSSGVSNVEICHSLKPTSIYCKGERGPVAQQRPGAHTRVYVEKALGMTYTSRSGSGKVSGTAAAVFPSASCCVACPEASPRRPYNARLWGSSGELQSSKRAAMGESKPSRR
jgi:hypothetical protein